MILKKPDFSLFLKPSSWTFIHQLNTVFGIVVLCLALIGSLTIGFLQGKREAQSIIDNGTQITRNFARQSELVLLTGITTHAEKPAEITMSFPSVSEVQVYNLTGEQVYHQGLSTDWTPDPQNLPDDLFLHETGQFWHIIAPVKTRIEEMLDSPFGTLVDKSEKLGYVHISINKQQWLKQRSDLFRENMTIVSFSVLVMLLLLHFLTRRIVLPLNTLAGIMRLTELGINKDRAQESGPYEIKHMAIAFNKMIDVLTQRNKLLDEKNNQLLNEIRQRESAENDREKMQGQLLQAQKMEAMGQLTGGIAHDFNNILASVLGYTTLALDLSKKENNQKLIEYLSQVNDSGLRARDLVLQMLAFSRKGANSQTEKILQPVAPIIDQATKMLRSILPKSIEININTSESLPNILVDTVQLHQILMNLSINARDAMNNQGSITIRTQLRKITNGRCHSCHKEITGDFMELTVTDTGSGIPPEIQHKIFDPFYTTKDVGRGSGMGLSMVHGIVHKHNGHLLMESTMGKGTSFIILLPLVDKDATYSDMSSGKEESVQYAVLDRKERVDNQSTTILVIDDEKTVGQFIKTLLEDNGYQVIYESDPVKALKEIEEKTTNVDLIITDASMPKLNGLELTRRLKKIRPDLPVIMCTGYFEDMETTEVHEAGIRLLLRKPVDIQLLTQGIQDVMSNAHDRISMN